MERLPLLLLFLSHVCVDASQGILPVAAAKLKSLFSLDYFQVGLLMMLLNITSSVIQPIFGFISDRVSTGWFIPAGILWTALAMGLLGWVPSYEAALVLVGLSGLGTAAFHPRAMMATYLVSGVRRGLGTAMFSTGGNLGFAVGPALGGFLIVGFGLRGTLGLLAPALILCAVILLYARPMLRRRPGDGRGRGASPSRERLPVPWFPLLAVSLIVTIRSWVHLSLITFMPMLLQDRGVDLRSSSLLLTVFLGAGAVAGLYGGDLSDRIGRRSVIVGSMLLYPLLAALMLSSHGAWLWVFSGAAGAALLGSFSVTMVLAQELAPRHLGLISGLILGLSFGTGGVGSAVSGYLADHIGLERTAWILALAPLAAAGLGVLIRPRPCRRP